MFGFFEKKEAHVDEVKAPAFVEWKGWRKFKVMNRKQECVDTTTFTLMPADEQPLPAFRAGQGVALRLEGFEPRAYTLCSTPDEGCYRITIKVLDNDRGALSAQLAQCLHVGDEIEVSEPAGGFVLDDRETPVVMIAEGIGITPMVAMLSEIATVHIPPEGRRVRDAEPQPQSRAEDFVRRAASDKELMEIFERTYGKIDREKRYAMRTPKKQERVSSKPQHIYKGKEYLLVDGYNMIFAWEELKKAAAQSLDLARSMLVNRLCN